MYVCFVYPYFFRSAVFFRKLLKLQVSEKTFPVSSLVSNKLRIKIYKTVILPAVLYGCETWSPTLREEHRLRVFENRVLRRIFGPKREED